MIVSDHTTKVFDADLIKLTQKVAEMGGFAQKQITDAMEALARRDLRSRPSGRRCRCSR